MFKRQRTGSVLCASCGSLVGVNDDQCYTCGRRNPGLWGFGSVLRRLETEFGFANMVVYGSVGLYLIGLVVTIALGGDVLGGGGPFNMLSAAGPVQYMLGASGAQPVFGWGMWWTVLSAGWLHAGALHLLFNMMWVRNLAPAVADIYGAARMIVIYTIASIVGFALSSVAGLWHIPKFGSSFTVGASAPIFGLLGALMHYGRRGGSSMIHAEAKGYAVAMFVFGLLMPGVDNAAHAGGFVGGYLASMWLDPLKREQINHMVMAVVCLALTALAIAASVATILPLILRGY
jgi:membrane associated rhomboid family serine protease